MDETVKDYWNKVYDILLKERILHVKELDHYYKECSRLEKEINNIDSSLNKLLEMHSEICD